MSGTPRRTPLVLEPISDAGGARIPGVDLSRALSSEVFAAIREAFRTYLILTFPDQVLTPEQQIAFSRLWGALEVSSNSKYLLAGHPEILILSNSRNEKGENIGVVDAGVEWHSDFSWKANPSLGSILYNLKNPKSGSNTAFANMYLAYDSLPEATKRRISGLWGIHSVSKLDNPRVKILDSRPDARAHYQKQRQAHPPVAHPLVRIHPETARPILFCSPRFTIAIQDMADAQAQPLLDELFAQQARPEIGFAYEWSKRDLVIWDNRCIVHHACGGYAWPDIRLIHRTTIAGHAPF